VSLLGKAVYTPPRLPVLRWLTAGRANVRPQTLDRLTGEMFGSPNVVILGFFNGLLFNMVAHHLAGGFVFVWFIVIDALLAGLRLQIVRRGAAAAVLGKRTPTDIYLLTAICWCALQGAMVFAAMRSCNTVLEVIAGCTGMALIGPICARNYPAPRFATLLICLADFPLLTGVIMTGNRWMAIILVQTPLLLLSYVFVMRRLQAMAVALIEAEDASQQRARRDGLTGLLNREGLGDVLLGLHASAKPFVIFYLDLDGFKAVNDTLGHRAGDTLLQAVAARLQAMTRDSDTVARLGGDEFVIVTPDLGPTESAALASSVIHRITDTEYALGPEALARIGVSIGYACWPEDGATLDLLREHADLALYEAKKSGKGVHRRFVGRDAVGGAANLGWNGGDRRGAA